MIWAWHNKTQQSDLVKMAVLGVRGIFLMSDMKSYPLFSHALILLLGISIHSASHAQSWSAEEKVEHFSQQTHHWGQKNQSSSNNGWSKYRTLKIYLEGPNYFVFNQQGRELLVEAYSIETAERIFRAVSIPRAGLFFSPKGSSNCMPDGIEQIGMYAEIVLFYLSKLLPQGPGGIIPQELIEANGIDAELRFMQAVARISKPWFLEGKVDLSNDNQYMFEIVESSSRSTFRVEWSSEQGQMISSSESVENWDTCWSGTFSTNGAGDNSFSSNIKNVNNISTFGEIRKEML